MGLNGEGLRRVVVFRVVVSSGEGFFSRPSRRRRPVPSIAVFLSDPLRFRVFFSSTGDTAASEGLRGLSSSSLMPSVCSFAVPVPPLSALDLKKVSFESKLPDKLLLWPPGAITSGGAS
jgi:hypothetical protein